MLKAFIELTGKKPAYIFLDEIHNVENYGSWFRKRLNAKIYLSGSSYSLTPRKIAEELRGRSINYEIYQLSFREYLYFLKDKSIQNYCLILSTEEESSLFLKIIFTMELILQYRKGCRSYCFKIKHKS